MPAPSGVALDGSGNFFIVDRLNHRIRKVDTSGIITTVAGNGIFGFSGDGGPGTSASLFTPSGVALDGSGNLFIADRNNQRIRKVSFLNPPTLSLSTADLSFADQLMDTTSSAQNVTLTNTGNAVINVSSIFATGDFAVTNDCGASVAVGASCVLSVTFTPTDIGTRTGSVTIVTDAAGSPHVIDLSGTVVELWLKVTAFSQLEKTIEAGETATFQMMLIVDGMTGTCFLSCSGAPAGATCTVEPAEIGLGGPVTTTVVASVRTTALTSGAATFPGPTGRIPWQPWFFVLVVVVSMVEAMRRRGSIIPTLRLKRAYVGLGAILLMVGLWTACWTGGMPNVGGVGGGIRGTPPGTSTLTVTVRTSSGHSMSAAVTLNVR